MRTFKPPKIFGPVEIDLNSFLEKMGLVKLPMEMILLWSI